MVLEAATQRQINYPLAILKRTVRIFNWYLTGMFGVVLMFASLFMNDK